MRIAPQSLACQLTLLLLAFAAAQGIAVALFAWGARWRYAMRSATVARLLGGTPPGLYDSDRDDNHDDDEDRDRDDDDHNPDHREPGWFTALALADGRWLNVAVSTPPAAPA